MAIKREACRGCIDEAYHNWGDCKECWLFAEANMVRKIDVPVDQRPPYNHIKTTKRPDCYRRRGYVRIDVPLKEVLNK